MKVTVRTKDTEVEFIEDVECVEVVSARGAILTVTETERDGMLRKWHSAPQPEQIPFPQVHDGGKQ